MLTSPHGQPRCLVFAEAQPGDQFYLVETSDITGSPISVTLFTVDMVGKRDIICTNNSRALEKRIKRDCTLWNVYLTREEVAWAKDAIRLGNKQRAAWKAIQTHKIEALPEDLSDRIIAWGQALEDEKGKAHE
ncbi:hypothetical protein GGI1_06962 [Acidithiobacillus sp. GGI-221]|nr:hypothetical protein GGI1_06962 [Acidithiobacillus sp. GGI-221]